MPCDPFEMALVHSGFRRELHNAAGLVGGVSAGDSRRAAVVYEHIDFMMTAVHFSSFGRGPGRVAKIVRPGAWPSRRVDPDGGCAPHHR